MFIAARAKSLRYNTHPILGPTIDSGVNGLNNSYSIIPNPAVYIPVT